ncbi:uncharacterized protein LOC101899594 [Musca domestica]|uniref:Uncharacterized protein LOC101899594 n=1 Tax=Musca domestica TaxID=7370 RepID=A0A1I8M7K3_MUSDO|nr:uncharacterized protein LOC101899594 [Musca domestica]
MSCICEYFIHSKDRDIGVTSDSNSKISLPGSSNNKEVSSLGSDASASEIASARAEIWLLKKSVHENRISIENLENLVKVMMERQNVMLTEMYRLKRSNFELREECRIQRDYHSMERNAMLRELHDIRQLLSNRSKMLEETTLKNAELINSVQDANEKIYLMGMKYLKLKNVNYQPLMIKNYSESSDECEEELGDECSESEKSD